jgi:putative membrane protein
MRMVFSIVGNAIALLATTVVSGITFTGSWLELLLAGAIFGLLNFLVKPVAIILSLPALILSLGLFYFVLNALLLWGFSKFLPGYTVAGFWPALLGSLVLMLVNWVLHALFGGKNKKKEERA